MPSFYTPRTCSAGVSILRAASRWDANRRGADLGIVLQDALESRKIARALQRLVPTDEGYRRLREALVRERVIAAQGGWPNDLHERLRLEGISRAVTRCNSVCAASSADTVWRRAQSWTPPHAPSST